MVKRHSYSDSVLTLLCGSDKNSLTCSFDPLVELLDVIVISLFSGIVSSTECVYDMFVYIYIFDIWKKCLKICKVLLFVNNKNTGYYDDFTER
jgi:hypothetical protein